MAMVIAVGTTFAMTQGILGALCVRVPVSYLTSRRVRGNLFRIGMATLASSLVQTALCVLYYIRANKFLQKQSEKPVFRSNSPRNPPPGNERLHIFDFITNGLSIYMYALCCVGDMTHCENHGQTPSYSGLPEISAKPGFICSGFPADS